MGERANIVFVDRNTKDISPIIYVQNLGRANDITRLLGRTKTQMSDRAEVDLICARFVQQVTNEISSFGEDVLSIRLTNADIQTMPKRDKAFGAERIFNNSINEIIDRYSDEDHGLYIVDVSTQPTEKNINITKNSADWKIENITTNKKVTDLSLYGSTVEY